MKSMAGVVAWLVDSSGAFVVCVCVVCVWFLVYIGALFVPVSFVWLVDSSGAFVVLVSFAWFGFR